MRTGAGSELVVLVRGRVFARYPGTIVYLTRSTTPGVAGSERVLPAFRAELTVDVTFFGFAVPAAQLQAATWFLHLGFAILVKPVYRAADRRSQSRTARCCARSPS